MNLNEFDAERTAALYEVLTQLGEVSDIPFPDLYHAAIMLIVHRIGQCAKLLKCNPQDVLDNAFMNITHYLNRNRHLIDDL